MEFLKNNWSKLCLALITFVCAVLWLLPICTGPASEFNFLGASQFFAPMLFFIGMTVFYCLKMFDKTKKYSTYVLIGTGLLASLFFIIGFIGFKSTADTSEGLFGRLYGQAKQGVDAGKKLGDAVTSTAAYKEVVSMYYGILATYLSMFLMFGIVPIVNGVKKLLCKKNAQASAAK